LENMEEMVQLDSSKSTQTSLQAIREGNAGLNAHRQTMLDRVPEIGDFASFRYESLELIDLAYLTARTGHEFAILRGKDVDILFHGEKITRWRTPAVRSWSAVRTGCSAIPRPGRTPVWLYSLCWKPPKPTD